MRPCGYVLRHPNGAKSPQKCPSVWIMPDASVATPGALLLCRAEPAAVRPVAHLLREKMLLAPAGDGWSVLVPAAKPWLTGADPVDQVLAGWAGALTVGAGWPAIALWWDASRWLHPGRGISPDGRLRLARRRHTGRRGRGDAYVRGPARSRPRTRCGGLGWPDPPRLGRRRQGPAPRPDRDPGPHGRRPALRPHPGRTHRPAAFGGRRAGRRDDRVVRLARCRTRRTRRGRGQSAGALGARPQGAPVGCRPARGGPSARRVGPAAGAAAAGWRRVRS